MHSVTDIQKAEILKTFQEVRDKSYFYKDNYLSEVDILWYLDLNFKYIDKWECKEFTVLVFENNGIYYASLPFFKNRIVNTIAFSLCKKDFETKYKQKLKILDVKTSFIQLLEQNKIEFSKKEYDQEFIYAKDTLTTFSGKKLQSKRSNLNYFKSNFENIWTFRKALPEDEELITQFIKHWNTKINDPSKGREIEQNHLLNNLKMLLLNNKYKNAVLVNQQGLLEGFICGTQVNDQVALLFLKNTYEVRGVQQFLISKFLLDMFVDFETINMGGTIPYLENEEEQKRLTNYKMQYYPIKQEPIYGIEIK